MNVVAAEETLKEYLYQGIATDIALADQAYALAKEIAQHAKQINEANFGELFGSLQLTLSDQQTLAVTKLVDPVGKHPTRSIPGALKLLEKHATLWRIPDREMLIRYLVQDGAEGSYLEQLSNNELTHAVVNHFQSTLPSAERLRQIRNKVIAHNEAIERSALSLPTWGEALRLTNYAKDFVTTISHGYLGALYHHSSIPKRPAIQLRRLLRAANIAEGRQASGP